MYSPTRCYFYPRSPCGERPVHFVGLSALAPISIHALLAESDNTPIKAYNIIKDFYPRSPCGERRDVIAVITEAQSISIHALLAESDYQANAVDQILPGHISIHALLAESDIRKHSTPNSGRNFYPRSPCGERQSFGNSCTQAVPISIHALLAESDWHH